jgi:hypothetical protein
MRPIRWAPPSIRISSLMNAYLTEGGPALRVLAVLVYFNAGTLRGREAIRALSAQTAIEP